ncbi:MAG: 2Fe-2S iron-sulfur cluster-binding protein [Pseudomonadota bacterium]
MPKATFVSHAGEATTIDVAAGHSLMEGAVQNDISGIEAECGGACACATCHVYVEPEWLAKLPERSPIEEDMLSCAAEPMQENSRLSCQVQMSDALDGITVKLPEIQG